MEKLKPDRVGPEDTGPVKITLCDRGDGNDEEPNLTDQTDGRTSSTNYTGNTRDPCNALLRSTNDKDSTCLTGGEQGMTSSGASVEDDNNAGDNGGGNDASMQENKGSNKPQKRAVRADWYSFEFRGTMYHIKMNSLLGETYRNLATKAEQREFMIEHGESEPVVGPRVRPAR